MMTRVMVLFVGALISLGHVSTKKNKTKHTKNTKTKNNPQKTVKWSPKK
jgi:hypothetical protein